MKKNDTVTLKIEDYSAEGLGIGHCEGFALFVKDAVIGDVAEAGIVKMKKTYGYARLMRILTPSPDRIEAPCPVARPCGGCQIQQMAYGAQLRFKEQKVKNNLQRIGGFTDLPIEPIIGIDTGNGTDAVPFRFRNKAQYPISRDAKGALTAGFYAERSHRVVDCRDCLIGAEVNRQILDIVLSHMEQYDVDPYDEATGEGLVRHVIIRVSRELLGEAAGEETGNGQIMVCIVINGFALPAEEVLVNQLRAIPGMTSITLNRNCACTNVILGDRLRLLWGKEYIEDTISGVRFRISPRSFYQVNPIQTEKLYGKVLQYAALTGLETVWDLYCGIGTISLSLAKNAAHVYGIEVVPEAVDDARINAELNGITNAEFFVGKAEDLLPRKYREENISADVMVVDPPRKGCEESVLDTMLLIHPERIVYVSCDSATLARDLRHLCGGGYEIQRMCPVDMFGHSVHIETVALLVKLKKSAF